MLAVGDEDATVTADADAVDREEFVGLSGLYGTWPQSKRNLPSLSYFATRTPAYPSATKNVPSGSQAMSVTRLKWFGPRPGTPRTPMVFTRVPSLVKTLISCMSSSTIHRCFEGS
jgi:hypothetical protein